MYVEVVARPGVEELQLCCRPNAQNLADEGAYAARIIVVFTTAAEATAALTLARFLAVKDMRIWLVCPVTRTLLGQLRLERFMRFAKRCADLLPAHTLDRLRILACPCRIGRDPVEEFTNARAILLIRTRWFRRWGRGVHGAMVMQAHRLSLIL